MRRKFGATVFLSEKGNCTVGSVSFSEGKVEFISSGRIGPDPKLLEIEESELRTLLDVLFKAPDANGQTFNPYDLVAVSNSFINAGKAKTFLAFSEYARINADALTVREKLLILSRCLHDSSESCFEQLPAFPVGDPFQFSQIKKSEILDACPQFPISFLNDVPILHTIDGYAPAGGAQRPLKSLISLLEKKIVFRAEPIPVRTCWSKV